MNNVAKRETVIDEQRKRVIVASKEKFICTPPQKLVIESLKTINLLKQHYKKHPIPGIYEQYQKIQQILDIEQELKNEFTIRDVSYFFRLYYLPKSILEITESELKELLKEYFYGKSRTYYYYFRMDLEYEVANDSRIGTGLIMPFLSLPQKVRKRLEDGYPHDQNRGDFANQILEQYKELRSSDHYMKIKIISKGQDNSIQKAINSFYSNKSIFQFFTLSHFREESQTSSVFISTDENDDMMVQSFGQANEMQPYNKTFMIDFIPKINRMLDKKESDRCDIEKKILLAINVAGANDSNPDVNIRFLFCIIAMEVLLIENPDRGITHRLVERITFLLADDEDWLTYYNTMTLQKSKHNIQILQKHIKEHLKDSRIQLSSTIYELYSKRSSIAHNSRSNITENDYSLAKLLLLKLVIKMLGLFDQGIKCIDNGQYPKNESLKYVIDQLKFG